MAQMLLPGATGQFLPSAQQSSSAAVAEWLAVFLLADLEQRARSDDVLERVLHQHQHLPDIVALWYISVKDAAATFHHSYFSVVCRTPTGVWKASLHF